MTISEVLIITSIVQVDKKYNISLKKVKDALKIQPNDTFSIKKVNTHTFTLKKIGDEDPFITSVMNPGHVTSKKKINLRLLEDELWSA